MRKLPHGLPTGFTLHELKDGYVLATLIAFDGDREQTRAALGISRRTLSNYITRLRESGADVPPAMNSSTW